MCYITAHQAQTPADSLRTWRSASAVSCEGFLRMQTPDAVLADITPAERLKYEGHFAKVKRTGGWVDAKTAKQFFTKAGLPVTAGTCIALSPVY